MITTDTVKSLVFNVKGKSFGIPVDRIVEVFQVNDILKVPRTSKILAGIVNLRGNIISILSLSVILWDEEITKEEAFNKETEEVEYNIILVNYQENRIGLLVNEIVQLIDLLPIEESDKEDISELGIKDTSSIIDTRKTADGMKVLIIDLETVLSKYVITKESKPTITTTSEEDFDFDISQYTLPDK